MLFRSDRQRGTPNTFTGEGRPLLLQALKRAGGEAVVTTSTLAPLRRFVSAGLRCAPPYVRVANSASRQNPFTIRICSTVLHVASSS